VGLVEEIASGISPRQFVQAFSIGSTVVQGYASARRCWRGGAGKCPPGCHTHRKFR